MNNSTSTRLNKFISDSGLCSRREADKFIEKGSVFINGKKAKIGDQVFAGDRVMVNGHNIEPKEEDNFVLLAFNKPVGVTSTTEAAVKNNIVEYVNYSQRIFPIGRLDKDSSGLIFLTNNGDIVNKILRAGNQHEKEYVVTVNKPITDEFISGMSNGVPILGVNTKKCKVRKVSTFVFNIILVQGLNRQIRRMADYFNYEVVKLERIRIMNISLKGIGLGDFRELNSDELTDIMGKIQNSSSEAKPKVKKPSKTKKNDWDNFEEVEYQKPKTYNKNTKPAAKRNDSKKSSNSGPSKNNSKGRSHNSKNSNSNNKAKPFKRGR